MKNLKLLVCTRRAKVVNEKPLLDLVSQLNLGGYVLVGSDQDHLDPESLVVGVRAESTPILIDIPRTLATIQRFRGTSNLLVVASICKDTYLVKGRYADVVKYLEFERVEVGDTKVLPMYPTSLETGEQDYLVTSTILQSRSSHRRLLDYLASPRFEGLSGGEVSSMISQLTNIDRSDVEVVLEMLDPVIASILLDKWETSDGGEVSDQIVEIGSLGYAFFDDKSIGIVKRLGSTNEGQLKYLRSLDSKARNFLITKVAKDILSEIEGKGGRLSNE